MKYRGVIEHLKDILDTETLWKSFGMGLCDDSYISLALGSTADASWKAATDAVFKSDDTKPKSWQISAAYLF